MNILYEVQSHLRADTLGIAASSSCRVLPVNTMMKNELLFSPCFIFMPIFFLFELFTEQERRGGWESCRTTRRLDFGCVRCSIWPVTKEFRLWACWGAFCPRGNKTNAHNFLMPPTHMCSSKQELAIWRKWLFMTQITQEWAHLVIKRSRRTCPVPPWCES